MTALAYRRPSRRPDPRPRIIQPDHAKQEREGATYAHVFRKQLRGGDTRSAAAAMVLAFERGTVNYG